MNDNLPAFDPDAQRRPAGPDRVDITLTDVSLRLTGREVLSSIGARLRGGDVIAVTGPNGAGKSTLLGVLAGLHPGYLGEVSIDGARPGTDPARRRTGLLPTPPPLYDYLSVAEHLELLARLWQVPPDLPDRLERARLTELAARPAGQLSLGQRQRLALALVTFHEPRLLLLDEPFNGLDRDSAQSLAAAIRRHSVGGGVTVVATHLLESLEGVATRLLYLHEGRLLHDLPVAAGRLAALVDRVRVELAEDDEPVPEARLATAGQ